MRSILHSWPMYTYFPIDTYTTKGGMPSPYPTCSSWLVSCTTCMCIEYPASWCHASSIGGQRHVGVLCRRRPHTMSTKTAHQGFMFDSPSQPVFRTRVRIPAWCSIFNRAAAHAHPASTFTFSPLLVPGTINPTIPPCHLTLGLLTRCVA
jgi:hypothetical protein